MSEYENSQKGSVQEPFDTNCISPGTDFMSNFSRAIKGYVASRLACSPIWANVGYSFFV